MSSIERECQTIESSFHNDSLFNVTNKYETMHVNENDVSVGLVYGNEGEDAYPARGTAILGKSSAKFREIKEAHRMLAHKERLVSKVQLHKEKRKQSQEAYSGGEGHSNEDIGESRLGRFRTNTSPKQLMGSHTMPPPGDWRTRS